MFRYQHYRVCMQVWSFSGSLGPFWEAASGCFEGLLSSLRSALGFLDRIWSPLNGSISILRRSQNGCQRLWSIFEGLKNGIAWKLCFVNVCSEVYVVGLKASRGLLESVRNPCGPSKTFHTFSKASVQQNRCSKCKTTRKEAIYLFQIPRLALCFGRSSEGVFRTNSKGIFCECPF